MAATFFMEILDGTILSTAAPGIAASLGVRPPEVGVAITAYLITLAVGIPVSGWLADRCGTRTVFVAAIAVFTVASALCAVSTSLPELAALRVLQGAGGALMVPVGRLVVMRRTRKQDVIRTIAFLTWPGLVAPVVAPLAGGLLTTYLSWRWIFLINLPLGLVAGIVAVRVVPQLVRPERRAMDWTGFVLTGLSLAAALAASTAVAAATVDPLLVEISAGVAGVAGGAVWRHLRRAERPLLDLRLLSVRSFRVGHAGGGIYRATVFAVPFVLPLMFQEGFGWSPVRAGAMVMAVFAGNLAIKPATTTILRRWRFRTVIVGSAAVVAVTMLLLAIVPADLNPVPLAALLVVSGAARSVGFTAYGTLTYADIDAARMTDATTLSSTLQQLAGGFGVAVGALGIAVGARLAGPDAPAVTAYRIAFVLIGVLTLSVLLEAVRLGRDAGHGLHGAAAAAPRAGA